MNDPSPWLTHLGSAALAAAITLVLAWLMLPVKRRQLQTANEIDLDAFKEQRAISRADEDEQIARMGKLTEMYVTHRKHGITPNDLHRYRQQIVTASDESISSVRPVQDELGPNGHPVGLSPNGDKVEWLPNEEELGGEPWPMILLRNESDLHAAAQEMFERVWWVRHHVLKEQHPKEWADTPEDIRNRAESKAAEIESKYGRESLVLDDFEWGVVNGKLSALRWVTGSEWDMLDT
ncbi:hypothetical protein ACERK3_14130 [Phycisphaerales bacterium AB-hyl4]|uniref:Uncharacterized protein n=1 Tax=Natronomicrosphaera hydrolytica TaxID=3242702 RepID=A0ABV4UAU4_9BACT